MAQFKAGNSYGNDLTITIEKRTPKMATIKTTAWGSQRVKIYNAGTEQEYISFKAWLVYADETFDLEESKDNFYRNAYEN